MSSTRSTTKRSTAWLQSGGILIWGIKTEKVNEIDCAVAETPFDNPDEARAKLDGLTDATDPRMPGVENATIHHPTEAGKGFVKTYVPPSDGPVYFAGGRAFRRDAVGNHRITSSALGDMYGRQARPDLKVAVLDRRPFILDAEPPEHAQHRPTVRTRVYLLLGLQNTGRGLARFPSVRFRLYGSTGYVIDDTYKPHLAMIPMPKGDPRICHFAGGVNDVIHSESYLPVATLLIIISLDLIDGRIQPIRPVADLVLDYTVYAEGVRPKSDTLIYPASKVAARLDEVLLGGKPMMEWFEKQERLLNILRTGCGPSP